MPKIYYRCKVCYSKVKKVVLTYGVGMCNKCNTGRLIYECQHNYWWELVYLQLREMWRAWRRLK